MGVDHGRFHVFMPQKLLNSPDVDAVYEEMGGETVPQGVNRCMLRNGGLPDGGSNGVLDGFFTQVVPSDLPASGIYRELRRGENILPDPYPLRHSDISGPAHRADKPPQTPPRDPDRGAP